MRKLPMAILAAAALTAAPAQAHSPKPKPQAKSHHCEPKSIGFNWHFMMSPITGAPA